MHDLVGKLNWGILVVESLCSVGTCPLYSCIPAGFPGSKKN